MKHIIVGIITTGLLSGCSLFMPSTQRLSITTDQPDAEIFVNSQSITPGMGSVNVKRNKEVVIMVTKPGYERAYHHIGTHISTAGVLDILGILVFLVPVIGLLTPGSRSLDETSVVIPLNPILLRPAQSRALTALP